MTKILTSNENNIIINNKKKETAWSSIHVICLLAFSSAVQFTLYFSSTNQFLKTLDPNATEFFYGLIIASYSIGNVLFSPIMGYLSNKIKQIKILLFFGLFCQFFGNLVYFYVEIIPFNRKIFLLIGRFITGIGASNVSLMKAYISGASSPDDRSKCIAYITGSMAVGAFIGPAFQLLFTPLGYPGYSVFGFFQIHMFNLPALVSILFVVINFILVLYIFKEIYVDILVKDEDNDISLPPYDRIAVLLCYITRFCQTFISTNLETLAAVISMSVFSYTTTESINVISLVNTGRAIIALLTALLFVFVNIEKYISLRNTIIICTLSAFLFHFITYPYGFYKNVITYYSPGNSFNSSFVGCNVARYLWCKELSPCNPYLYYISHTIMIGSTYSSINICLNTLFSKIIGPRRQAFEQGTLNMSKGISQMISPPLIGFVFDYAGLKLVWIIHIIVLSGAIVLWLVYYKRMVSFIQSDINKYNSTISEELSINAISKNESKTKNIETISTTNPRISESLTRVSEIYSKNFNI
ncbi:Major facilitator superfamily and Major facilitator superfamily domain, general substrate transporter and Major facilitator superfamily domain-containing protein [Strongyloides ratti]|uniref:Major facilitator superfamily and Major facilitator superfamily domain, general substrate transporter and Major facilitator superfamily domain-containing protein n=1 Tax=Strongyloides ratti TaxID=34506 RepID=A0A090LBV8_STRRB|nr:Major facilitator superfamily and Major facilitator superfamily domain, general substrate transporter and Major facilitator superfamily domain-containing protein [Strongyloides ratti]CEF67212.1 Major facilitator superfamily and Major facilitator superfamily domain, general substrate transporter and Major facilitator superfamily domain-containing protein [Strongyloides ratti]